MWFQIQEAKCIRRPQIKLDNGFKISMIFSLNYKVKCRKNIDKNKLAIKDWLQQYMTKKA